MTAELHQDESARSVLRRLILPIYLPAMLVQTGAGMLVPLLPLYLRDQVGLSFTLVTLVMAAAGVGSMLSQLPVGTILAKSSERPVMMLALVVLALSTMLLGITGFAVALGALRFAWGIGSTGWLLSRQTLMTRATPSHVRGRAMSLFGGTARLGQLIGSILGGYVAFRFGFGAAFTLVAAITIVGIIPLALDRNPLTTQRPAPAPETTFFGGFREHRELLVLAGFGQVATIAVRTGRLVVLPLIATSLGLNEAEVGVLVGIGLFGDLLLFPLAGWIMDKFGRLHAIVPAFCGLGVGLLMLARANDYAGVATAAIVIGLSNSIGSGTMLTLASDLAPREHPSQFLATLGTLRESGKIAGPIMVGWLADLAGLSAAAAMLGVLSFVATALLVFGIGETRDRIPTPSPTG